ncbi:TPA: dynamin family protein [Escherichia coli]|nr:hypothetical protein [Escherichia coli]HAI6729500.1 hypothetical protein [Escherichia coli]HAX4851977.1 hypothetical protein [Escherichia coli]HAX4913992.1 hypothetical protein [Escherichia coli]HAX5133563.1 hypothetical protein [Escherichia coli]
MYTQTLYELSQEAERLLQLSRQQLQLLEKIPLSVPGDDAPQLALPWSQPNIAERHAMLNNELRKISRLEMVLAIVGTMKAGKSTTINAIVGTEVLPNRNRPMTALPTLIRHTPGQKEPVLHFSHVAPIDHLIQQLQQRLCDCDIKYLTDVLEIDKDMRALMQRIENGIAFEKYYLGAQPIFHCLKSLNDLVRLAKALDVDFPFSAYAAIEHIPVIEVEFVHLAGLESYPGQLTLTQIAQHLALLQKMDHRQHSAFPELPQQIAALYEWFSARCRWKEKALTQRGLLVQAGEQSEQIFTRWRAGAYNAWSLPGRCFIVLEELRWGAFGDACRLGSPQAVALLLGDLRVKATQHLAESINAAPTTRHYYHQWFASSTVSTGGDHADFLSWLGKWSTADKQPVCWSVTQRWRTVALGMPRLCSAQRLAGAMVEEIFSVNMV